MTAPFIADLSDAQWALSLDGSKPASATLNAIARDVPEGSILIAPLSAVLALDDTFYYAQNRSELTLYSWANPWAVFKGPRLRWTGKQGGTILSMDRSRYCRLQGFVLDDVTGADIALSVDGYVPSGGMGTQCEVERVAISNTQGREQWVGISIAERNHADVMAGRPAGNQEYHTFKRVLIRGKNRRGTGIRIADGNAKQVGIEDWTTLQALAVGIDGMAGLQTFRVNLGDNSVDVIVRDAQDATVLARHNSEGSGQGLVFEGQGTLTIEHGRFAPYATTPGKGYFQFNVASQALIQSNTFDQAPPAGSTLYSNISNRGISFRNNYYGSGGFTLKQLGLDVNVGNWDMEGDGPVLELGLPRDRAATRIASAHADLRGRWDRSVMIGDAKASPIQQIQEATVTLVPSVIAAGKRGELTVTVLGMRPGDFVACGPQRQSGTVTLEEIVAGTDTATFVFLNTGSKSAMPRAGAYRLLLVRTTAT